MALDPRNVVILTGGLTKDPEVLLPKTPNSNISGIVKMSLGVNRAGPNYNSGYFDVTFFANSGDAHSDFVLRQIDANNFKKGTSLQIIGRLTQEKWESDGKNHAKVSIIAETIAYGDSRRPDSEENSVGEHSDSAGTSKPALSSSLPSSW